MSPWKPEQPTEVLRTVRFAFLNRVDAPRAVTWKQELLSDRYPSGSCCAYPVQDPGRQCAMARRCEQRGKAQNKTKAGGEEPIELAAAGVAFVVVVLHYLGFVPVQVPEEKVARKVVD